jgi:DNA-binding winged helix-turn-helix (wHTH) protein
MADVRPNGVKRLRQRRWTFADCVFDESNWALIVAGRRVPIEIKPLELLRTLLLHAGNVVSKAELLDAVWPDVEVVEASLTTAVRKLRGALGDDRRKVHIIETAQRIGYRLAVPVTVEELAAPPEPNITPFRSPEIAGAAVRVPYADGRGAQPWTRLMAVGGLAALAVAVLTITGQPASSVKPKANYSTREVETAMRKLDVDKAEAMIAAGWQPDTPLDAERNTALGSALNICEWDPDHDRRKLQLMVRTLLDGGARLDRRNAWGDTPYSIAKAPRYCGPNHPVTQMIRRLCGQGLNPYLDRCMASYELARGKHFVPAPLPKG